MHALFRNCAIALCAPFAAATVLTFDDIGGLDGYGAVPANYGGLDWSQSAMSVFTAWDTPFTPHSGQGQASADWTDAGSFANTIRFLVPTVFDGAWFSGYGDGSVHFDLYFGGQLVGSSAALQLSADSSFLDAGWRGVVDAVVVSTDLQGSYAMDDFTFGGSTQVPEPGSLALVLGGLGLAGAMRLQRAKR